MFAHTNVQMPKKTFMRHLNLTMTKNRFVMTVTKGIIVFIAFIVTVHSDCHHRDYGNGATVCVCSESFCDDIKPIEITSKGIVTSYVTSKNGDRFAKNFTHFVSKLDKVVSDSAVKVVLDRSHRYQKILGFGGAFTDATGINIAKLPQKLQIRLMKDYYGSDGIEYTMGRIPIGGSDFSTRPYSYDDNPGDETLDKFELQKEDFLYKIPYLQMAQQVSGDELKYFGTPWSSPAWMKTNNKLNNGGFLIGEPGGKYYKLFAKYIVKFLEEYNKNNISLWGITVENEPSFGYDSNYSFNSLGFNSTLERDFVKLDLGPELNNAGWKQLNVMIFDDNIPNIKEFATTVLSDDIAASFVSGIAFHWYRNRVSDRTQLDQLYTKFPKHFLLSTEACEEWSGKTNHVSLGNWQTFDRYTEDIIKDLNHYTSGWIDWNLVLDLQGGPNWVGNYVDAPIIVNQTSGEYYKQPFFYALGHFSKFLLPESVRIHHTSEGEMNENIQLTVFERPDNGTVLAMLNKNDHPFNMTVQDDTNGYLVVEVQANSLLTLIWYS